jgi:hypothetical protein
MIGVYLISEDTLKTETILNDNVSAEYFGPSIECAQEIYLQQLIGTSLLNDLCEKVRDNRLNDDDKTLLDEYITPYLKFKVLAEVTLPIAFKYRNAGIVQTNNEYVYNTGLKDAQQLATHYDQRANFFAIRLTDWLCANSTKFPAYHNTTTGELSPNKGAFNTSIFLN